MDESIAVYSDIENDPNKLGYLGTNYLGIGHG